MSRSHRWSCSVLLASAAALAAASSVGAASLPSWERVIPDGAKRFKVLTVFAEQAVLDRETGLVWHRSPFPASTVDWASSLALCVGTAIGGRRGWRLPTAWELMTLKDPGQSNPALPPNHPFEDVVEGTIYWTSTAAGDDSDAALALTFTNGGSGVIITSKTTLGLRWCVRGPGGDYPGTP
jgi:hypothetical protein